jgi:hypothetical protein
MIGPDTLPWWFNPNSNTSSENDKRGKLGYLSYDIYLGLAILGGFFGLDHLYLRSPLTALAKMWCNIIFFGAWWFYDAVQAFFNSDIIKVYGLSIPGLGPRGIGSGCLVHDEEEWIPHKDHMSFFVYGLVLLFAGVVGVDSYIVGDKQSFVIRIICFISVFATPIAMMWWAYKLFMYLFQPTDVINKYPGFFGKAGGDLNNSFLTNIIQKIFGFIPAILVEPLKILNGTINKVPGLITVALKSTTDVTDNLKDIVTKVADTVKVTADTVGKSIEGLKDVRTLATRPNLVQSALATGGMQSNPMKGGGTESNVLSYILMGTIVIISVSGFISTYRRSKKNEPNDQPPEPRISREFVKNSN